MTNLPAAAFHLPVLHVIRFFNPPTFQGLKERYITGIEQQMPCRKRDHDQHGFKAVMPIDPACRAIVASLHWFVSSRQHSHTVRSDLSYYSYTVAFSIFVRCLGTFIRLFDPRHDAPFMKDMMLAGWRMILGGNRKVDSVIFLMSAHPPQHYKSGRWCWACPLLWCR